MLLTSDGGGRQQSFTQKAAQNELKLGEGGWLSAWRWRRGVRRRQGRRTNDQAGVRAAELQPDFNTIQVCLVENIKEIKCSQNLWIFIIFTTILIVG